MNKRQRTLYRALRFYRLLAYILFVGAGLALVAGVLGEFSSRNSGGSLFIVGIVGFVVGLLAAFNCWFIASGIEVLAALDTRVEFLVQQKRQEKR